MRKHLIRSLIGAGIVVISMFISINSSLVNGETDYAVEMISDHEVLYGEDAAVEVSVLFHDKTYYNSQVYLSYHLKDKEGNMVCFENERYALPIDENTQALVTVNPNISDSSITSENKLYLQFDLVDQENLFWFSQREDISFGGITVPWNIKGTGVDFFRLSREILNNPIIFTINIAVFIAFSGAVVYIARKRDR